MLVQVAKFLGIPALKAEQLLPRASCWHDCTVPSAAYSVDSGTHSLLHQFFAEPSHLLLQQLQWAQAKGFKMVPANLTHSWQQIEGQIEGLQINRTAFSKQPAKDLNSYLHQLQPKRLFQAQSPQAQPPDAQAQSANATSKAQSTSAATKTPIDKTICVLQDHQPINSTAVLRMFESGAGVDISVLSSLWTRAYACRHGYRYLYASSPELSVWPTTAPEDRAAISDLKSTCKGIADSPHEPGNASLDSLNIPTDTLPALSCSKAEGSKQSKDVQLKRGSSWCKVLLFDKAFATLSACDVVLFMDSDVFLREVSKDGKALPPFHEQPQIRDWLKDNNSNVFISREPHKGSTSASKNASGRNVMRNTLITTAFVAIKRHSGIRSLLADWWCSVNGPCERKEDTTDQYTAGCYRRDWAREQYAFQQVFLAKDSRLTGDRGGTTMTLSKENNDYNTPDGRFAAHYFFKGNRQAKMEVLIATSTVQSQILSPDGTWTSCSI